MSASRPLALITGARRGIGRACGEALARDGFDIAATDLVADEDAASAMASFTELGATAEFYRHDVADVASHGALVAKALQRFGRLDCFVGNAGRGAALRADLLALTPENYDAVLNVNLRGAVFLTQEVAKAMLTQGDKGAPRCIIGVTSISAQMASPERAEYCISKAGLSMALANFALRLAPERIAVFEIRPGIIRTPMTAPVAAHYDAAIAGGLTPAMRWGEPDDVGRAVAALASGRFAFATGSIINVDGGMSVARL